MTEVTFDRDAAVDLILAQLHSLRGYLEKQAGPELRKHETVSDLVQSACCQALRDLDLRKPPQT